MKNVLAACATVLWVGSAHAATILEGSYGEFSSIATNPTIISGANSIEGTGDANQYDIFRIDGLSPGAQNVSFTFSSPAGVGPSYAAGGSLYYKTTAFDYNWDGLNAGSYGVYGASDTDSFTLSLDATFAGTLFVGLYHTFGSGMSYTVSTEAAAVVPVPATGMLFLSSLLGLSILRRNKL